MRSFSNKAGSLNTFVQSPIDKENDIQEMINLLQSVREVENVGAIDDEIANLILRMSGPLQIQAKL